MSGVLLIEQNPAIAERDCGHCQLYQYDESKGKVIKDKVTRKPLKRISPPLCRSTGCPKGTPENQKSLSERNRDAYVHYLKCKAVGAFPDDPIVQRNAMLISETIQSEKDRREQEFRNNLILLATKR